MSKTYALIFPMTSHFPLSKNQSPNQGLSKCSPHTTSLISQAIFSPILNVLHIHLAHFHSMITPSKLQSSEHCMCCSLCLKAILAYIPMDHPFPSFWPLVKYFYKRRLFDHKAVEKQQHTHLFFHHFPLYYTSSLFSTELNTYYFFLSYEKIFESKNLVFFPLKYFHTYNNARYKVSTQLIFI